MNLFKSLNLLIILNNRLNWDKLKNKQYFFPAYFKTQ